MIDLAISNGNTLHGNSDHPKHLKHYVPAEPRQCATTNSTTMKFFKLAFCVCVMLVTLAPITVSSAYDIEVVMDGATRTIGSYPHKPHLSVGSIEQLRQHFHKIKPFLPKMPFKMEGKWVIPAPDGTFRLSAVDGIFSPNGDYAVQVEHRSDVFEFAPNSRRIRLLTYDGKLLWEKEWGPKNVLVTDDGRVIGDSRGSGQPLALVFYDRNGKEIKPWFSVFQQGYDVVGFWVQLMPECKLLLAWSNHQLVAIDFEGNMLWRYSLPIGAGSLGAGEPMLDPQGHGIYVPNSSKDGINLNLLDVKTGAVVTSIFKNQPFLPVIHFSPSGRYAGVIKVTDIQQGYIMDCKTGELLNPYQGQLHAKEDPDDFAVYNWALVAVSDDLPRLAVETRGRTAVFDAAGHTLWSCSIHPNRGIPSVSDTGKSTPPERYLHATKYTLSPDGQTLGIVLTKYIGFPVVKEFAGVLLYKIPTPQK